VNAILRVLKAALKVISGGLSGTRLSPLLLQHWRYLAGQALPFSQQQALRFGKMPSRVPICGKPGSRRYLRLTFKRRKYLSRWRSRKEKVAVLSLPEQ
jgi:hypothetical protein